MEKKLKTLKMTFMKRSPVNLILSAGVFLALASCNQDKKVQSATLTVGGIVAAKGGNSLKLDTALIPLARTTLPKGGKLPGVKVLNASNRQIGNLAVAGKFVTTDTNQITFTANSGEVYTININFPSQMSMPRFLPGAGSLKATNNSTPENANESFVLLRNNRLVLAYFWFTNPTPNKLVGGGNLIIQQQNIAHSPMEGENSPSN